MHPRKVIDDSGIEVQPDIRVARTLVARGIERILFDRQSGRTAAVYGVGIDTVRPCEIDHGVEPVPIALTVGCLQGVVAGVSTIGQLNDVSEVRRAVQLEYRIKRSTAIQGRRVEFCSRRSSLLSGVVWIVIVPTANRSVVQAAVQIVI